MDILALTQLMNEFVQSQGWYEADSTRPQTMRNLAISLNLEAAEILEHFQWSEELTNKEEFANELADVALYLLQLASLAEINMENAILHKLNQNYLRKWK